MQVVNFKLVNGDEIIAKLIRTDETYIVVDQPRALQIQDRGNGQFGAQFVPALVLGKDRDIIVYKNSISLYTENVGDDYEKHYLQSVSGIQLATSLQG